MTHLRLFSLAALAASATLGLGAQSSTQQPPPAQQPTDVTIRIGGSPGLPPKYAVPDFIALSNDAETLAAARTMGQVLWDDLNYEREFYLIPRDTYRTIPQPASLDQVPLDRWRELGADGVVVGSVRKTGTGIVVQVRLLDVASGKSAFAKEYSGSIANPRLYSHTVSDEIHLQQRALKGVARTKIAFTSDRDMVRIKGPVGDRGISEIYYSDYDGANPRRATVTRSLSITPAWSPDGKSIAYTSYRTRFQDIVVSYIFEGRMTTPASGTSEKQNYLPAWSPDGSKLAFTSNRDGNPEIYVVNRDGTGLRRLTNSPAIDVTPTWAPTGNQIAFTSERAGTPQIYIMNADGSGVRRISSEWSDRATWSPAPFNEIAYAARSGGGYDIRVYSFATGETVQLTNGIGSNESPAFSPNGRHIAFTSTRAGKEQIFTIARDGKDLRQITKDGVNRYPNWSNYPQ
jgi:TolB protein